ncbi:MAG: putative C-S lyase [Sulfuricurvum sp.]|nr:putative C-S lyase [Sulfuricurvum sp.]
MDEFAFVDRSKTNAEKYVLRQKLFGTEEVMPLWVADMDIATPECVLEAITKRLAHPIVGYEIMSDSAYEAQIEWFATHHDFVMKREWLSYSPSVVASIGCAIRAFSDAEDEVIVMDPVYPPFYSQVRENNRTLVIHTLNQDEEGIYRFDLDRLSTQTSEKTKVLLLCSPHNPVGRVWSYEELSALCRWCEERGIVIISDEIHCDLVYAPHKHISTARIIPENTVMLLGPGKTFNMAGFSISTVCIPSQLLRDKFEIERKRVHWGDGAVLSHIGFEAAYREGRGWYYKLIAHLSQNAEYIDKTLSSTPIQYAKPEATYLAWLDCRALGMDDRELRKFFVKEARLGLSPGLSFGKEGSGFMRLNFAVTSQTLTEALEKLRGALQGDAYV